MRKEPIDAKLLEDAHVLMHPIRYRIVELLAEKPRHINAVSSARGMEGRLITSHLATLEEHRFVTSKYEISEAGELKGKATRVYTVTDKMGEVKARLKKEL